MTDFAAQRTNMVESQVRPTDITDRRIIRAMAAIPREAFATSAYRSLAYMDGDLRVKHADAGRPPRYLLAPRTLARLVQLAEIGAGDVVLDVGCASGYSTAVLARLAQTVVALEEDGELADRATRTLADLGVDNAAVVQKPLVEGVPGEGPFDVVFLNGSVAEPPAKLLAQLKPLGRLVGVLDEGGVGRATIWRRVGAETVDRRAAFDASAPRLPGFDAVAMFSL